MSKKGEGTTFTIVLPDPKNSEAMSTNQ
jgi:hypothetical protein